MTKEALKGIIDQLRLLNSQEQMLFDCGLPINGITSKWYHVVALLLNEIYAISQVDFIVCYIYDDLTKFDQFKDIDSYDKFYDYLINLNTEDNGKETINEETSSEKTNG